MFYPIIVGPEMLKRNDKWKIEEITQRVLNWAIIEGSTWMPFYTLLVRRGLRNRAHMHPSFISKLWFLLKRTLSQLSQFCFFPPAKMREICRPLLNAWLNSNLVWNSETNENHARTATGVNRTTPIMYSYPLARALTELHMPSLFIADFQASDICSPI